MYGIFCVIWLHKNNLTPIRPKIFVELTLFSNKKQTLHQKIIKGHFTNRHIIFVFAILIKVNWTNSRYVRQCISKNTEKNLGVSK